MKKFLFLFLTLNMITLPSLAEVDKTSADYLQGKKHIALMNPFAEKVAQRVIAKTLSKEVAKGKYKVKLVGYTLSSMKKGVFKNLEIETKNIEIEQIPVLYLSLKSLTDYNWVDFNEDPVKIKSDMEFVYNLELTEKSLNEALKQKEYRKSLDDLNKRAYPLFAMDDVRVRIKHDKLHIIMDYSLPLASNKKKRSFMVSTGIAVNNGKIRATNIGIDNAYGNLPIDKVTNLINLIDPLSFTLVRLNESNCNGQIENVKIEDNIIKINGKISVVRK